MSLSDIEAALRDMAYNGGPFTYYGVLAKMHELANGNPGVVERRRGSGGDKGASIHSDPLKSSAMVRDATQVHTGANISAQRPDKQ